MRICKICEKPLKGRRDKKFCSLGCKNEYHAQIHRDNVQATAQIDAILHRNRIILKEILGDNVKQKKVKRVLLDKNKFNFKYHTHTYFNSRGKTYHYVYEMGWMEFSTLEILIVKL